MKMVYLNCLKRSLCGHPELSNHILTVKTTHRINLGLCKRSLSVYPVVNRNFLGSRRATIQRDGALGRVLTDKNFPAVVRNFHTTQVSCQEQSRDKQLGEARSQGELTTGQKVVQAGTDAVYLGFIVVGIGIAGALFYVVGKELFSSQTPQGVFTTALKLCRKNEELCNELGDPIQGRGERNSRGRARHVSHMEFMRDGVEHMRVQFYLKGTIRQGTAQCEVRKNESGNWDIRFLLVEVDTYPSKTIIIEDNR